MVITHSVKGLRSGGLSHSLSSSSGSDTGTPLRSLRGPFPDKERALLNSYLRIVRLRLGEIARRILHELGHSDLIYEAVGLALKLRIYGAIGLYVLAHCKAHGAPVAELAGHGHSRRGHTKQESARDGGLETNSNHGFLLSGSGISSR